LPLDSKYYRAVVLSHQIADETNKYRLISYLMRRTSKKNIMDNLEIWADINGFENFYQVSNQGNIRSCDRIDCRSKTAKIRQGCKLNPTPNSGGYLQVYLYRNGKKFVFRMHTLVASTFLGKRPESLVINHKDGIKTNNFATNLEYCSQKQNAKHARDCGLWNPLKGQSCYQSKLTDFDVVNIKNRLANSESCSKIAKDFNVGSTAIHEIRSGKNWKHIS